MSKHTPGPWFPVAKNSEWNEVARIGAAWGICTDLPLADMGHPKNDAALLSAAPDLLTALRMWMEIHQTPAGFVGKFGKELDAAIEVQQTKVDAAASAARAAIAKATGDAA